MPQPFALAFCFHSHLNKLFEAERRLPIYLLASFICLIFPQTGCTLLEDVMEAHVSDQLNASIRIPINGLTVHQ
jgi:hypothetical protein